MTYTVFLCVVWSEKQQALLYTAQNSYLNSRLQKCTYRLWVRSVRLSLQRRAWQSLNFDKEYLWFWDFCFCNFRDLIYAQTACNTPNRKENLKSHHMTPLIHLEVEFIRIICSWSELHRSRWMLLLASLGHTVVKHPYCRWVYSVAHMIKKTRLLLFCQYKDFFVVVGSLRCQVFHCIFQNFSFLLCLSLFCLPQEWKWGLAYRKCQVG